MRVPGSEPHIIGHSSMFRLIFPTAVAEPTEPVATMLLLELHHRKDAPPGLSALHH